MFSSPASKIKPFPFVSIIPTDAGTFWNTFIRFITRTRTVHWLVALCAAVIPINHDDFRFLRQMLLQFVSLKPESRLHSNRTVLFLHRHCWHILSLKGHCAFSLSTTPWRRTEVVDVPLLLDFGTRYKWVVRFTLRPLYCEGSNPWYPLDRRLGGPQSRSGRGGEEENSQPLPGLEPPDQPARNPTSYPMDKETKRPGREGDHSSSSSAEVKNVWSYTSITHFVFVAWYLVKYRMLLHGVTVKPKGNFTLFCLLTPWCRIFEKLIVTQLIKKYPFFVEPEGSLPCSKIPPLDPILSQTNPFRPIDPYLPKIHLNVILPPTPRSSQWFSYIRASQPKPCKHLCPPPCVPHGPPTSSSLTVYFALPFRITIMLTYTFGGPSSAVWMV
jgi:hypothetical protein